LRHADGRPPILLEELSSGFERSMIIPMTTTSRLQQRDDHRLRDLVRRTGNVAIGTDLGIPRSTARGWLGAVPTVVVGLNLADLGVDSPCVRPGGSCSFQAGSAKPGDSVKVTVRYDYHSIFPLLFGQTIEMSSTVQMVLE
jgi:hypothetical protein